MSKMSVYAEWYGDLKRYYASKVGRDLLGDYPSENRSYPFLQDYLAGMSSKELAISLAMQGGTDVSRFG